MNGKELTKFVVQLNQILKQIISNLLLRLKAALDNVSAFDNRDFLLELDLISKDLEPDGDLNHLQALDQLLTLEAERIDLVNTSNLSNSSAAISSPANPYPSELSNSIFPQPPGRSSTSEHHLIFAKPEKSAELSPAISSLIKNLARNGIYLLSEKSFTTSSTPTLEALKTPLNTQSMQILQFSIQELTIDSEQDDLSILNNSNSIKADSPSETIPYLNEEDSEIPSSVILEELKNLVRTELFKLQQNSDLVEHPVKTAYDRFIELVKSAK